MSRKWMAAGALAAVIALGGGILLGRKVIEGSDAERAAEKPTTTLFKEPITNVSILLPSSWTRLQSTDREVRLLAAADPSASLLMRVTKTGLATVTDRSLPVVKQYTDTLLAQDARAKQLNPPAAVDLGGLPGWRYRYTYSGKDGTSGAHVHYFLFKDGRLIQLVFQAVPADRLDPLEPTFDRLAATFRSTSP